jgi:exopolyphosphatase/guanosine-5'-triphosphate,3'-diphosphate pyrophosphatase
MAAGSCDARASPSSARLDAAGETDDRARSDGRRGLLRLSPNVRGSRIQDGKSVTRVGIVDLGSNTVRLVVYACEEEKSYRLVDQIREPIRLAEGAAAAGRLSEAAMERALTALGLISDYIHDMHLADVKVVATSAARDVANGAEFIDSVRDLGLEVDVLDGEQEAEYGVLAVANGFSFDDAWVVDLGGGSAQVSRMDHRTFAGGDAYPLGAVRLTELYLSTDPPAADEVERLRAAVKEQLADVVAGIRDKPDPLVAIGGTIRNLARAVQATSDYPIGQVHGLFVRRKDLEALVQRLVRTKAKRRARMAGIKPDRADIIVAGALVYETLLREADLNGLHVSGQGIREGVLFTRMFPDPHLMPVVRKFGIHNLFSHYPQPLAHTEHVRFLSRRLFDELKPLHGYGWEEAQLLDEAAQLHDIGMTVGYHGHHRHGAFLIDNTLLPGMTHREKALITLLVRYHRKSKPKPGPFRKLLREGDQELLEALTTCLRFAEHLERARANRIKDVEVTIEKRRVDLRLIAVRPPPVEIYETEKQAWLFEKAFGRKLEISYTLADS